MTAQPRRRRRSTIFGFATGSVLVIVAIVLAVIGAFTLANSTEGTAVVVDERTVARFPDTPNVGLAVVDDEGALTSLVVMTLLPEGQGGSIVTVPVNADVNVGVEPERVPLDTLLDPDDPEAFADEVSATLGITLERFEVVDAERLAELVSPVMPATVNLSADVIDSSGVGTGIVTTSGENTVRTSVFVDALTAVDDDRPSDYANHPLDVALWVGAAANAPVPGGSVPTDEIGRPVPPGDVDELVRRLWAGPVAVRDLALLEVAAPEGPVDLGASSEPSTSSPPSTAMPDASPDASTDASSTSTVVERPADADDVVVVDRRDAFLVFGQISPGLVSTPSPGLSFRLELGFSDEQLGESDLFETNSEAARRLIGEILFFQGNVVSVDTAPFEGGAPSVTRVEVADAQFLDDAEEFAPILFGESEVVLAEELIEGVDAVVTVGTGYLDHRAGT